MRPAHLTLLRRTRHVFGTHLTECMVFGRIANMGVFFQHDQGWTTSYYFGVGAVLLALWAVWTVRDRRVWLLSIAGFPLKLSYEHAGKTARIAGF